MEDSRTGRKVPKPGAGRPPGKKKKGRGPPRRQTENGERSYSELSGQEKLQYHREAAKVSKGYTTSTDQDQTPSNLDDVVLVRGRGRPPNDSDIGAMDDEALKVSWQGSSTDRSTTGCQCRLEEG